MSEAVAVDDADARDGEPAGDASRARRHHVTYLLMSLAVLVLSCALSVTSPETVGVRAFGGELRVPPLCPLQAWSGLTCPGCGLTRGLVSLLHGEVTSAVAFHPLSPLFLLLVAWQLPYRAFMLRRGEWLPPRRLGLFHRWVGHLTIAALILVWVGRLALTAPTG